MKRFCERKHKRWTDGNVQTAFKVGPGAFLACISWGGLLNRSQSLQCINFSRNEVAPRATADSSFAASYVVFLLENEVAINFLLVEGNFALGRLFIFNFKMICRIKFFQISKHVSASDVIRRGEEIRACVLEMAVTITVAGWMWIISLIYRLERRICLLKKSRPSKDTHYRKGVFVIWKCVRSFVTSCLKYGPPKVSTEWWDKVFWRTMNGPTLSLLL